MEANDTNTNHEPKPESLDTMIQRHRDELNSALRREQAAARAAGRDAQAAVRADVATATAEALDALRGQLTQQSRTGQLPIVVVRGGIPSELKGPFQAAEAEALPGERVFLVLVPQPDRFGHQERRAYAVLDVSKEVWG